MSGNATLPQDDPDLPGRGEKLGRARGTYAISFDIVPGVPMAATVPEASTPTAAWTLATLGPIRKIFANVIANRLATKAQDIDKAWEKAAGKGVTLKRLFKGLAAVAEEVGDFVEDLDQRATHALMHQILTGTHITHNEDDLSSSPWDAPLTPHGRPQSIKSYDSLYLKIDHPPVIKVWHDDSWFSQMRVAGPNPILLEGITALPGNFPVSEEHYSVSAKPGDTLAAALAEGRLFLLDYKLIGETVHDNMKPVLGAMKYTPAPLALFGVHPGKGTLRPIAIQVGQDPSKFAITTPVDGWSWRKARLAVQVADANYHELVGHLGRTHLIMEAASLATVRNLSERHPLYKLLMPHFEGTIAINNSAAHSMLAPGGVIDLSFGGTLESMIELARRTVTEYDFHAAMPPADFARRRVGPESKLSDYPFRDDSLRVWEAISEWAESYVDHYYSEASLKADAELAAWSAALCAPVKEGGIGGFTPTTDKASLATALAMIMFTASAQHAAVNFTQWADMSYTPALAGALWTEWKDGDATEQDWLDLLPPLQFGELQAEFLALLGGVHHTHLGEYKDNTWPYEPMITDPGIVKGPLAAFQGKLREIEFLIARENKELTSRSAPYEYLMPSRIPASINI